MTVPTETLREWVEDVDEHGGGADLTEGVVAAIRELIHRRELDVAGGAGGLPCGNSRTPDRFCWSPMGHAGLCGYSTEPGR